MTGKLFYYSGFVGLGGAMGAMCRYWLTFSLNLLWMNAFPIGTFVVNVLGSFLMGLLTMVLFETLPFSDSLRSLILTGLLGGFTTFSAFSLETIKLIDSGDIWTAVAYVVFSVLFCLIATAFGMWIGSW